MKPELDASLRKMADGTVLIMQVGYENTNRVYSYAMLKAGGYWYVTGSGKAPRLPGGVRCDTGSARTGAWSSGSSV